MFSFLTVPNFLILLMRLFAFFSSENKPACMYICLFTLLTLTFLSRSINSTFTSSLPFSIISNLFAAA